MNNQGENLVVTMITFNRLDYTKRAIESLFRTVPKAKFIIYDNNSFQEGMKDYLKSIEDKATIVYSPTDDGWGFANNRRIAMAKVLNPEFILMSDNDVEYYDGWYEKCLEAYKNHPNIGVLGTWKHTSHGMLPNGNLGDIIVKDQMPGVSWLMKSEVLNDIGAFVEHGPYFNKGGTGEDVNYCIRADQKGYLVCGLKDDVAIHIDGY